MSNKPNWETVNFDHIMEWCQEFMCYAYVEDELSDIGIHCKEVEEGINTALLMLKSELDKMELIDDE
jgi:hypothetical protein